MLTFECLISSNELFEFVIVIKLATFFSFKSRKANLVVLLQLQASAKKQSQVVALRKMVGLTIVQVCYRKDQY